MIEAHFRWNEDTSGGGHGQLAVGSWLFAEGRLTGSRSNGFEPRSLLKYSGCMRRNQRTVGVAFAVIGILVMATIIVTINKSSSRKDARTIEAKKFINVHQVIEDFALLSEGRVVVSDGPWVRVYNDSGEQLEQREFPDWVWSILTYDDGREFIVALADGSVWKANDNDEFERFGEVPFAAEMLFDNGRKMIATGMETLFILDLETRNRQKLHPTDPSLGGMVFDEEEQLLYVGSTDHGLYDHVRGDEQHSLYCYDLKDGELKWDVWADDVNGLAIIEGQLVSSERRAIRILDLESGRVLDEQKVGLQSWSEPTIMDSFLFERYVLHPLGSAGFEVWDLKGEQGIVMVAEISPGGRLARITAIYGQFQNEKAFGRVRGNFATTRQALHHDHETGHHATHY